MLQTLYIEYRKQQVNTEMIKKDPEEALKILIANQSSGVVNINFFHTIIRAVMNSNNSKNKRLFYYYLETVKNSEAIDLCLNQINKDLEHPNEHIRIAALRFIKTLDGYDSISNLLKSVKENLFYKHPLVRMNAVETLSTVAEKFEIDIEDVLYRMLKNESNKNVLMGIMIAIERLDLFSDDILDIEYPKEIVIMQIRRTENVEFLCKCLETNVSEVKYTATVSILRIASRPNDSEEGRRIGCSLKEKIMECVVEILKKEPKYMKDFVPYVKYLETHVVELLELVRYKDFDFAREIIERVFERASSEDYMHISNILYMKYVETIGNVVAKKRFRVLLLESMTKFSMKNGIYKSEMVNICLENLEEKWDDCDSDDVDILYKSLRFLSFCNGTQEKSQILKKLVGIYDKIIQGKLLRLVFDIMCRMMTKMYFERLLESLLGNFEKKKVPPYLCGDSIYNGGHICLCIVDMYRKEWGVRENLLGVLVKFLYEGKSRKISDLSTDSVVTGCIRKVLRENVDGTTEDEFRKNKNDLSVKGNSVDLKEESVNSLIKPEMLSIFDEMNGFDWNSIFDHKKRVFQLSGLGDPLYVEATVNYSRAEIVMDILMINQTEYCLRNVNFDWIYPKYLRMIEREDEELVISEKSGTNFVLKFMIEDSLSYTVSGCISFRYPEGNEYTMTYLQNLNDIVFGIEDFLEPVNIEDFQYEWTKLVWENLYKTMLRRSVNNIATEISKRINGSVVESVGYGDFQAANIAAKTLRNNHVLVNVCVSRSEDATTVELRIRAHDDEIVKNVSNVISSFLKSYK